MGRCTIFSQTKSTEVWITIHPETLKLLETIDIDHFIFIIASFLDVSTGKKVPSNA